MQLTHLVVLAQSGFYENPDGWTYVTVGYALCILGIVAYTISLMIRGRRLARRVPPEEQRWMPARDGESAA